MRIRTNQPSGPTIEHRLPTTYEGFLQAVLASEMDQLAVVDGARALDEGSEASLASWAAVVLAQDEPSDLMGLRAAQVAAALLPDTLDTVLLGLRSTSDEVRFCVVCSLADAPKRALKLHERALVSAVWDAAVTSSDSDVEVIAADFLALVGRKAARREIEDRDLTLSSDFFLWLLCKDVFGRRCRPRSLARETYRRKRKV